MLSTKNLNYRVQRKSILSSINLDFFPGELTMILGANGAGKSTLLKLLSGDIHPCAGDILVSEKRHSDWPRKLLAQRRAVMPQSLSIEFPLLAKEVVTMGCSPHQDGKAQADIVNQCMAMLDVAHLDKRLYPTLSGGEQQRVQLARALAQIWPREQVTGTKYLLLDECSSAMDIACQHLTMQVLRRLLSENVCVVAIVHDLNLAAQYADKLVLMSGGEVIAQGAPWEVLTPENIQQVFNIDAQVIAHPHLKTPLVLH